MIIFHVFFFLVPLLSQYWLWQNKLFCNIIRVIKCFVSCTDLKCVMLKKKISRVATIPVEHVPALVMGISWRAVTPHTRKTCFPSAVTFPYDSHPCPWTWKTTFLINENILCDASRITVWCLKVVLSAWGFWHCMLEVRVKHQLHVNKIVSK